MARRLQGRAFVMVFAAVTLVLQTGCRGKSVDDYLGQGEQALKSSQLSSAEQAFMAAEKLAPNDPRTHLGLASLYMAEHNPDVAIGEYNEALKLDPRSAKAHGGLGKIYADRSQYSQAEEQYRAAIALDPSNANSHLGLAWVLERTNRNAEAEREIKTALGLAPQNAQAHFAMANLLSHTPGREADADSEYSQAQSLDPSLVRPGSAPAPAAVAAPRVPPAPAAAPSTAAAALPEEAGPAEEGRPPRAEGARPSGQVAASNVRPLNKKFLLTHNSPVYESPAADSAVVGQVHRSRFVHVTGISGDWLQVRLKTGVVGFIPASAAE